MTSDADDPDQRHRDWEIACHFSSALKDQARALLREGASIQAVADGLQVPLGAVRNWSIKVEREGRKRSHLQRRDKRPDWASYDASVITEARHRATSGATAAELVAEFELPEKVANYIVRRARMHQRQRERQAAQAATAG